jgi:hypothetical protein
VQVASPAAAYWPAGHAAQVVSLVTEQDGDTKMIVAGETSWLMLTV